MSGLTMADAPQTVFGMFQRSAIRGGDLPFLVWSRCADRSYLPEGLEVTYRQAAAEISRVAEIYRSAGYGPGQRVAVVLGNQPEYFWHFLALNSLGACAVPVNPDYLAHEFTHAFRQAEVSLVVAAAEDFAALEIAAAAVGYPLSVARALDEELPAPAIAAHACPDAPLDRPALIIYTSGTTSRPKGCLVSNGSCLASGQSYADVGGLLTLHDRERLYVPLPTFHMNATVLALNAMLLTGGCLITTDRFRASTWWEEIRSSKATGVHYLGLIPPILLKAPDADGDRAHMVRFGLGAGVDPTIHAGFEERFGFPLIECWGMTETSRLIANAHEPREVHTRAFGRPHPPWEVRVADEDGKPVKNGEAGALLVRCGGADPRAGFFSAYVNDPEATEKAWTAGWFQTGDVVKQGADGMLYFVERRKNIIRRSGENIAAAEIEEVIIMDPAVSGVAVVAVADDLRDEEPLAFIVPSGRADPDEGLATAIFTRAKNRLANHKLPGWIQFVDEIPVTPTQKVRKDMLLANFHAEQDGVTFDLRPQKARTKATRKAG